VPFESNSQQTEISQPKSEHGGLANFVRKITDSERLQDVSPSAEQSGWVNRSNLLGAAVFGAAAIISVRHIGPKAGVAETASAIKSMIKGADTSGARIESVERVAEIARLESKKANLLLGSEKLAQHMVAEYPQVSPAGAIRWHFGGSLSANLLAKAERFVELDSAKLPLRVPLRTVEMTPEARVGFLQFARRVGDIDGFPLTPVKEWAPYFEKYHHRDDLGAAALAALRPSTNVKGERDKFLFDFLDIDPKKLKLVALQIGDKEVFATDPRTLAARKFVHSLEQFGRGGNETKFAGDFSHLFEGASGIYGRPDVKRSIEQAFDIERESGRIALYLHHYARRFNGSLGELADEFVAKDPNAQWLSQLTIDSSRSIEVLKALGRLTRDEDKKTMINFVNKHRELAEEWSIVDSPKTRKAMAEHIMLERPDVMKRLEPFLQTKTGKVSDIADGMAGFYEMHRDIASTMSSPLPRRPDKSQLIEALLHVDPSKVKRELDGMDRLLQFASPLRASAMLRDEAAQDPVIRSLLFDGIKKIDLGKMQKNEKSEFSWQIYSAVTDFRREIKPGDWQEITMPDRRDLLANVLRNFGGR